MERQTGPGGPEAEKTSMKAAPAAASDGGYCVVRVSASAGHRRPVRWVSLAVKAEAAVSAVSGCFAGVSRARRPDLSLMGIVVPAGGGCNPVLRGDSALSELLARAGV
jgi:hypothetical protein